MPLDLPRRPNFLVIITDQERAPMHWPPGWADANLPSMRRLKRHGLDFRNAFINTCQCSPSRATLHTSTYPAEHLVTTTFGPGPGKRPQALRANQRNFAQVLQAAGYHVAYKGKWHLTRPLSVPGQTPGTWSAADIDHLARRYGYAAWNPPDAGNSLNDVTTLGGGKARHDRRYLTGQTVRGRGPAFGQSAIDFLESYDGDQPFCLFVSLVNPHDVFVYPRLYRKAGFKLKDFKSLPIDLPPTYDEDLSTKPLIQRVLRHYLDRYDPLRNDREARLYARFYAWLHTVVDREISLLLDAVDALGLSDDTLIIRTSDHGEMGVAHGGLRQKEYNCYDETLRVPLVISNPVLFPESTVTDSLASLIDLLPTVAAVAEVPSAMRQGFRGVDLTPVLVDASASVQEFVHFTYDDDFLPDSGAPGYIRCIRSKHWKYAVYFDPLTANVEYEMYDLDRDPLETHNLAAPQPNGGEPAPQRHALHRQLSVVMARCGTAPDTIRWPE